MFCKSLVTLPLILFKDIWVLTGNPDGRQWKITIMQWKHRWGSKGKQVKNCIMTAYYKKYCIEPEPGKVPAGVNLKEVKRILKKLKSRHDIYTLSTEYMPYHLKRLRALLIEDNFIFDDITENQFCHIFSNQFVSKYTKRITWRKSKESLRYFLENFIPGIYIYKDQIKNLFNDKTGNPMIINKANRNLILRKEIRKRIDKIILSFN